MNDELRELADIYFRDVHGVHFDGMLMPIAESLPVGDPLAGAVFYQEVGEARRQDDPSLPMGPWAHELKHADWHQVAKLTAQAIAERSKDMQLVAWLLEAEIHRHGYAAVAPCLLLMEALLDTYWDDLYPQMEDGDNEHRANIIRWINERLLAPLSLIPLTACGWERGEITWADLERASRNEHLRLVHGGNVTAEGFSRTDVMSALAATATELHRQTYAELQAALQAIASLDDSLNRHFGEDAPGLSKLAGLLTDVSDLIEGELHKRGVTRVEVVTEVAAPETGDAERASALPAPQLEVPAENRAEAYAQLAEIGELLMRIDPHSPVPYLIRRAVEWGQMDTRELYEEVFMRLGGQLNIFDLVGAAPGAGNEGMEPD
jgi:type VI secretion system protein ImpA